jgi:hypothetical protein
MTEARRHAQLGDRGTRDCAHLLEIVFRTARSAAEHELFGCAATERSDHRVAQVLLVVQRPILLSEQRKAHRVAARVDRHVLCVLVVLAKLRADDVAGLVVGDLLQLVFGDRRALPLRAREHAVAGPREHHRLRSTYVRCARP